MQPMPTTPQPQTSARFPPIITSITRMMPSLCEWQQLYTLSNLDFVTQSSTLTAGKGNSPLAAIFLDGELPYDMTLGGVSSRDWNGIARTVLFHLRLPRKCQNSSTSDCVGSRGLPNRMFYVSCNLVFNFSSSLSLPHRSSCTQPFTQLQPHTSAHLINKTWVFQALSRGPDP